MPPVIDKEALDWFRKKTSQPTDKKSDQIAATWSVEARQAAFFSSRVAKADILEGIRLRIDDVLSGKMTEQQARWWVRDFLMTDGASSLRELGFLATNSEVNDADNLSELASTRRLTLIIEQNVRMAQAVGEYRRLQKDKDLFPYARYVTRDDGRVRESHAALDGKLFRTDSPELARIYPPNDFRCRCHIEPVMEDEVDVPISGPEDVPETLSESGFEFNPASGTNSIMKPRPQWKKDIKDAYRKDVKKTVEDGFLKRATKSVKDAIFKLFKF